MARFFCLVLPARRAARSSKTGGAVFLFLTGLRRAYITREHDADAARRHRLDELLLRRALAAILADEKYVAAIGLHLPQHRRIVVADDGLDLDRYSAMQLATIGIAWIHLPHLNFDIVQIVSGPNLQHDINAAFFE